MFKECIILQTIYMMIKMYDFSEFEVIDVTDSPTIQLYDTPDFEDLTLFYTKVSAMQPFQCKELWSFQDYGSILQDFEQKCFKENIKEMTVDSGRYPFVVIESNNKTHRDLISKKLAERFAGKVIYNPPECLLEHAPLFKKENPLNKAFTALGIYAASHSAQANYLDCPVIVSGYWNYAAALALDEILPNKTEAPSVGSVCYKFPKDLLLPDITIFIHIKKSLPPTQKYHWLLEEENQKPRWMQFLLLMPEHQIEIIDSCIEDRTILTEIEQRIDKKFVYEDK